MTPPLDSQFAVRLARLFFEAEFLASDVYSELLIELGAESRTWRQILEQDITSASFRMRGRGAEAQAVHSLTSPINISVPEIVAITSAFEPAAQDLVDFLADQGILSNQRADNIVQRAVDNADLLKILIDERALSPRVLSDLSSGDLQEKSREVRAQAAFDILVANGVVGSEELAELIGAAHDEERPLHEVLDKLISQEELARQIYSSLDVAHIDVTADDFCEDWEELFAPDFLNRLQFIPIERTEEHMTIAVGDALNFSIADALSVLTGLSIAQVQCDGDALAALISEAAPVGETVATPSSDGIPMSTELFTPDEIRAGEFTAVDIVRRLLETAVIRGATDIHIERMNNMLRARFRVDGVLRPVLEMPADLTEAVVSRLKVMSNLDVTERRHPQDGTFTIEDAHQHIDFRVSTLPTTLGEKIVLRVLDPIRIVRGFDDLGMTDDQVDALARAIKHPYGLILVTGPTGSGKTSTLYGSLSILNTSERNIITIEDPVEYRLDGVSQMQVDSNIDLTFAGGLRAALRQDPDVIMVGEVRDPETAGIAIRASLTGHLVLSTLHSNTAVGAVSALRHLGVRPYLAASSLLTVIAQRLVRRICEDCRQTLKAAPTILKDLDLPKSHKKAFAQGAGCQSCFFSGYRGRTGVYELLEVDEVLRNAIVDEATESAMLEIAVKQGFKPMKLQARQKAVDGVTSPGEAIQVCSMVG